MAADMDTQHMAEAWSSFQNGKLTDRSEVSELVMRTWLRCRECNISPEIPAYTQVPPSLLRKVKRKSAGLIASVHAAVTSLIAPAYGGLFNVVLVNSDGVTIYKQAAVSRQSGTPTSEGMVFELDRPGASAVATCLVEHVPVIFSGAEHYCKAFHGLHCHALPIFDHRRNFIAVLSLSTSIRNKCRIPPFFPSMIGRYIEAQNSIRGLWQEYDALLAVTDESLVILGRDLSVRYMNAQAKKFFGVEPGEFHAENEDFSAVAKSLRALIAAEGNFHRKLVDLGGPDGGAPVLLSHQETQDGCHVLKLAPPRQPAGAPGKRRPADGGGFSAVMGNSPALAGVLKSARKAVNSNVSVLLTGETGTGKELLAAAIHEAGPRGNKPFVAVNCGALSRELVLSTLFGYSPGAFTGASAKGQVGRLELADGGTLFLDEIGELPADVQAVLLRFLQDRIVTRVGSNSRKKVDVRIISATNKDLPRAVGNGTFRLDLFHRLNTLTLTLPPLRQRGNDILLLAEAFMRHAENPLGIGLDAFTEDARRYLLAYPWPGNIRELENAVARLLLNAESTRITRETLLQIIPPVAPMASRAGACPEKARLCALLERHRGNMRTAAADAGCSRSSLYYRVHKYGIDIAAFR